MSISEEDKQAKSESIEGYYNWLEKKINSLTHFYNNGYKTEALLLCCCYIDSLGNLRNPENGNKETFVYMLKKYSENELFGYIHPKMLIKTFVGGRIKKLNKIGGKIEAILKKHSGQFYSDREILNFAKPLLNSDEIEILTDNLWRGTYAAIAYEDVRCPAVHRFSGSNVSFDKTTYKGEPTPEIDFHILYEALKKVYSTMKEMALESNTWSGNPSK